MEAAKNITSFFYSQLFVTPTYPTDDWKTKTVIVTGSNTGLGLEAARHFVRLGASKVIIAVRSTEKGEKARESIIASEKCSKDVVEVWSLDLQSYDSVKAFAERCKSLDRIDAIVENAGIATDTFRLAEQHEATITTNVISTFLLALLLLPQLKATAKRHNTRPHLAIVSSEMHYYARVTQPAGTPIFKSLDDEKASDMAARYPLSKLLEVYVVRQLVEEYMTGNDYPVILNCLNPGLCESELAREAGLGVKILKLLLARTTEVGSRTLVQAASAGQESHGAYLSDCKPTRAAEHVVGPSGPAVQKRVWEELQDILEDIQPGISKNL